MFLFFDKNIVSSQSECTSYVGYGSFGWMSLINEIDTDFCPSVCCLNLKEKTFLNRLKKKNRIHNQEALYSCFSMGECFGHLWKWSLEITSQ